MLVLRAEYCQRGRVSCCLHLASMFLAYVSGYGFNVSVQVHENLRPLSRVIDPYYLRALHSVVWRRYTLLISLYVSIMYILREKQIFVIFINI